MSSKENSISDGRGNAPLIKQESVDHALPFSNATSRATNATGTSTTAVKVKPEPVATDNANLMSSTLSFNVKLEDTKDNVIKPEDAVDVASRSNTQVQPEAIQVKTPEPPKKDPNALKTIYANATDIVYTPENSLEHGLEMLKNIKYHVNKLEVGSKLRKDVWLREITNLEKQGSPSTMIAVCGATGAGKSSIMNAILDDNVVPTSGMRACTAVVTEISYHNHKTIAADVAFLSENEWREELQLLLEDLVDEDGTLKRTTDLRSEAGVAWHKVHAVYPKISQERLVGMNVDQLINLDKNIAKLLGSVKKIVAKDSREFAKQISKYIDSKDQKRGKKDKDSRKDDKSDEPALWPLIRQVNVRCNSEALRTGAILVDLPGVADANAARSSIAKDYMKKCNCIWILAPITRAVDDKTAKDLLGDAFKSQLMNGGFADVEGTITFIATKCDDISCTEVIRALQLEDDPVLEEIEERLSQVRDESRTWRTVKQTTEEELKGHDADLKEVRADAAEYQAHLKAVEEGEPFTPIRTKKKKSSNNEDDTPSKGKKRKNKRGGKTGSPKRRKSGAGEPDDFDMDLDLDDELDVDEILDDVDADMSDNDFGSDKSDNDSDNDDDSDDAKSDRSDDDDDKRSNPDVEQEQEEEDEPVTVESLKASIVEKRGEIKAIREKVNECRKRRKEAVDALSNLEKKKLKAQRDKNAFCSLRRSEFSKDVLKEDFRAGLKELDDAAAEKRDPNNFDPTVNLRDYSKINLPVFTASSRDYIRLTKQVKGDGDPTCFSNLEDTGVPELQRWCHTLTITSRERAARSFRTQLRAFATTVQSYIDNIGKVNDDDRAALREKWQSPQYNEHLDIYDGDDDGYGYNSDEDDDDYYGMGRRGRSSSEDPYDEYSSFRGGFFRGTQALYSFNNKPSQTQPATKQAAVGDNQGITKVLGDAFRKVVADSVKGMQASFKNGLEEKCQTGAENAIDVAVETSDAFAASMHWGTYRATLRRNGTWRRDLNEELIAPMTRNIASSWAGVFEADLFAPFETAGVAAINKLLQDFEESCAPALRDRARNQAEVCRQEATVALQKTLEVVREELSSGQKDVSRSLVPHVQGQLMSGYSRAMEERGTGSVARQKRVFHDFLNVNKEDLFEGGSEVIFEKLDKVAAGVGEALNVALRALVEKVEVNLSALWEGVKDDPEQRAARGMANEAIKIILGQIALWSDADKTRSLQVSSGNEPASMEE